MKISEYFKLGVTQHEIDFVDVDIENDTPLFIDPHFLASRKDAWSQDATRSIRSFFRHFLTLVKSGDREEALELFMALREPNETRLGLSRGKSQGRGVGRDDAAKIFNSISTSKAVQTGLVEDIEDSRIFVEGFDKDKASDMTTNIIRSQLIAYTQKQCRLWRIPLIPEVVSGKMWNRAEKVWEECHTEMLVVNSNKILLVPKGVVAFSLLYTPQRYYQHFVLNYLQSHHLSINSALVQERKPKRGRQIIRFVTKKSIKESEAPYSKEYLTTFTQSHPEVFRKFKEQNPRFNPLENEKLTSESVLPVIERLISALKEIKTGNETASLYHKTVAAILELIFYPQLVSPEIEREINQGRKRIDLVFDNAADTGFFLRLHQQHEIPCQYIMVECKNYGREIANPELDQLLGRFSPNRGKFGIIVCRSLQDEKLFIQRCADALQAQQGMVVPITDEDMIYILNNLKEGNVGSHEVVLSRKVKEIVMN